MSARSCWRAVERSPRSSYFPTSRRLAEVGRRSQLGVFEMSVSQTKEWKMEKLLRRLVILIFGVFGWVGAPSLASASTEPIIVVVRFFPAEGREDEAQARLANLAKFVPKANPGVTFQLHRTTKAPVIFLLYETFPSQAALDNQPKTVLPDFVKEFGPTPQGLFTRPNEVEIYRKLGD